MFVETMTAQEVYKEVYTDLQQLQNSTLIRLAHEYDRERRKKKIKLQEQYPKFYEVKTEKKNKWLILYEKPHTNVRYTGNNALCTPFTYYRTVFGLRVLKPIGTADGRFDGMTAYNGHLFARYNERMSLGLTDPLERVKHYFANNGCACIRKLRQGDRDFTMTIVKSGMLLGERQDPWFVQKTFISTKQLKGDQEELKEEVLDTIRIDIGQVWNADDFDRMVYTYLSASADL